MDPPVESQIRPVAEQLHVIDGRHIERGIAVLATSRTMRPARRTPACSALTSRSISRRSPPAALPRDRVVRIHPEEPLAARMPQRLVARGREVIAPGKMEQPPADTTSTIRGVSSTEPVSTITISSTQGRMLSKTRRQRPGRVADDHAQREPRPLPARLSRSPPPGPPRVQIAPPHLPPPAAFPPLATAIFWGWLI